MTTTYDNTKKGRSKVPHKPGAYNLKNRKGETVYTGMTSDGNTRIKQHHRDKNKHFPKFTFTETPTRKQADGIENKRLKRKKPKMNKMKK